MSVNHISVNNFSGKKMFSFASSDNCKAFFSPRRDQPPLRFRLISRPIRNTLFGCFKRALNWLKEYTC